MALFVIAHACTSGAIERPSEYPANFRLFRSAQTLTVPGIIDFSWHDKK